MHKLTFSYEDTCLLDQEQFEMLSKQLVDAAHRARKQYEQQYDTPYGFAYVPEDTEYQEHIKAVVDKKRSLEPAALFLIGIGGSSLGAKAIEDALRGVYAGECMSDIAFYSVDTIDTDKTRQLLHIARSYLDAGRNIVVNIVSKSGTTTETLINGSVFIDLLQQKRPDRYKQWIVVTTDEDSPLDTYAQEHGLDVLYVPQHVGGRYSVFTAVGMFPLGLLGIDTDGLRYGARNATKACLDATMDNSAMMSAIILYQHYARGRNIHDTFLFDANLLEVGNWYRQLMGESIGKRKGSDSQVIRVGITPTVSIGTVDLHSVAQLYLAGPHDKFTTFVYIEDQEKDIAIPDVDLTREIPVEGKSIEDVKRAILRGVQRAYKNEKRPFVSVALEDKSAQALGEFLQFKMFEMIYLADLFGVNAFNQPQVELYKSETRKILQEKKA